MAVVTEAQPNGLKLSRFIVDEMEKRHGIEIHVRTCW